MIYKLSAYGSSCNCYLIKDKKNILIDTGLPTSYELLKDEITKYVDNIDYIINTHCHYDHSGANYLYEEQYSCPTIINQKELNDLKNNTKTTVSALFGKELIPPKNIVPIQKEEIINELNNCNISFIETPGHTYGSISLIYENKLITGDTLFATGVGRWDLPTGNIIDLRKSIEKLEIIANEKNINDILPGHGENGNLMSFQSAKLFL